MSTDATVRALEREAAMGDQGALARLAAAVRRTGAVDAFQRDLEALATRVRTDARLREHDGTWRGRAGMPLDLDSVAARLDVAARASHATSFIVVGETFPHGGTQRHQQQRKGFLALDAAGASVTHPRSAGVARVLEQGDLRGRTP